MTPPDRARRPSVCRRDMLLGAAMAATGTVAWARMPHRKHMLITPGEIQRLAPLQVGPWRFQTTQGLVLPPPDQMAQLLYDQQVTRAYASLGSELPVMLLLAYGSSQNGMLQIHRPEICYPASGFRLSETREEVMPIGGGRSIPVRRFTAESDVRTEEVLYWTRIGDTLPVSWAQQRLAVVRSNLAGDVPDGLLVRMSSLTSDRGAAQAALRRFAAMLLEQVGPAGRHMLIADG